MYMKGGAYMHERRWLYVRKEEPMCMKGGAYVSEKRSLCA